MLNQPVGDAARGLGLSEGAVYIEREQVTLHACRGVLGEVEEAHDRAWILRPFYLGGKAHERRVDLGSANGYDRDLMWQRGTGKP